MTVKNWTLLIKKSLVLLVVLTISFSFYSEFSKIPKEQEIRLFRIAQELINNSIKHAKATEIKISSTKFDNFISLFYFDNVVGFNKKKSSGSGLSNIKDRIEIYNGNLSINSKKGKTTFDVKLPKKND